MRRAKLTLFQTGWLDGQHDFKAGTPKADTAAGRLVDGKMTQEGRARQQRGDAWADGYNNGWASAKARGKVVES
jgi:hypothetical protein